MPGILDASGKPVEQPADESKPQAPDELAQLRTTVSSLQETIQQLRGAVEFVASRPAVIAAPAAPAHEPDISDDDINAALRDADEGNPAAKVRGLVERATRRIESQLRQEVDSLRSSGLSSIAEITSVQASSQLPHFKEFEREIRSAVSKLDPALQARPDTWKFAHDAIVGANAGRLVERAVEEERRQHRDSAGRASTPGNGVDAALVDSKGNKVQSVEDLGGEDARVALRAKGVNEDEMARRMGYKSWADYLEKTSNLEEAVG